MHACVLVQVRDTNNTGTHSVETLFHITTNGQKHYLVPFKVHKITISEFMVIFVAIFITINNNDHHSKVMVPLNTNIKHLSGGGKAEKEENLSISAC